MSARGWSVLAVLSLMASPAAAEPKPKPVDIKEFRDKLVVLKDPDGGTYVVLPGTDGKVFYTAPPARRRTSARNAGSGAGK